MGYIHDSLSEVEIDPRNDPAIFSANNPTSDKGGVSEPQHKMTGGSPLTESSLMLLGAGRPYGS
jgi:hypothetical protein